MKFWFVRLLQNFQALEKYVLRELVKYVAYNSKNKKNYNNTDNFNIISSKRSLKSFLISLGKFSMEFITRKRYYGNEVKASDGLM